MQPRLPNASRARLKAMGSVIARYAVSDNLGSGLVLLLLVPTVALALGFLSARFVSERKS